IAHPRWASILLQPDCWPPSSVHVEALALAGIRIKHVLVDPFALLLIQIGRIRSWQFIEHGFDGVANCQIVRSRDGSLFGRRFVDLLVNSLASLNIAGEYSS